MPACRETRHWGYICDNTRPISNRSGNVLALYIKVLKTLLRAYEHRDNDRLIRFGRVGPIDKCNIKCFDATLGLQTLEARSIDAIITSPPYYGVCDYIKAQRLSFEWFGHDIEELRRQEMGARSKRHRGNARREYLTELRQTIESCRAVLKTGGVLAMVFGQSQARTPVLPDVRKLIADADFTLELDLNRRVTSRRRQVPSLKGEHLLIAHKTTN